MGREMVKANRSLAGAIWGLFCVLCLVHVSQAEEPLFGQRIIKAGDVLQISVIGSPEFSKIVVVSPQGRIYYPVLSDQNIIGWSFSELENQITRQLATVLRTAPYVFVDYAQTYTIEVNILGQVRNPGIVEVPNGIDLQGALWIAGGPEPSADLGDIQVRRRGLDSTEEISVDLERFLFEGRLQDIVQMKDGDLVIVRGAPDADKVKVFGEVNKSGSYVVPFGATVLDMIYLAGGPTTAGTLSDVRWIRKEGGRVSEQKLDFAAMLRAGRTDEIPRVGRGDVIIVQKRIVTLSAFLTTLGLAIQVLTLYLLALRV